MRADQQHLELYRSLAARAPFLASKNCKSHFSGELSCEWYHSTWPLLRLLDAVSTPYWHKDFYEFAMREVCDLRMLRTPRVQVVGAADFAMAAVTLEALPQLELNLSVIDQCETALLFNKEWATDTETPLKLHRSSIFNVENENSSIDIAVSDAFLTRFQSGDRQRVLLAISEMLVQGGTFITTVRDHSRVAKQSSWSERMLSPSGLTAKGKAALAAVGVDPGQMADFELRAVEYCQRMHSFPMNGLAEIADLCEKTRFQIKYAESCTTPGEFSPSTYIRLILERT